MRMGKTDGHLSFYRFKRHAGVLKEQNYPFSTQEAAFLVYSCKTATLAEKAQAWEEIIRTMPNCSMEKRLNMEAIPDFHAFLRQCITLLPRQALQFQEADGCVYLYEDASFSEKAYRAESGLFGTYDRCREAAWNKCGKKAGIAPASENINWIKRNMTLGMRAA